MNVAIFGGSGGLGTKLGLAFEEMFFKGSFRKEWYFKFLSSRDVDIRNYETCKKFFIENEIDIVINLAGVNHDKFIHKLEQKDQYLINHLLDVNLHGSVNLASACLPGMRERGFGRIIMISSVLATKNVMGTALYSSCKAFIDRFIKSISAENIGKGITANSIQLGYFDGGMTEKLPDPEKFKQEIPLKRWGTIEELADTIKYIVETQYLTGANIPLNGGL